MVSRNLEVKVDARDQSSDNLFNSTYSILGKMKYDLRSCAQWRKY